MRFPRMVPVLLAGVLFLQGCGGACSVSLSEGRSVSVTSDTLALNCSSTGPQSARAQLGSDVVEIEPTRILVNKKTVLQLDETTRTVHLIRSQGDLTILVNDLPVWVGKL